MPITFSLMRHSQANRILPFVPFSRQSHSHFYAILTQIAFSLLRHSHANHILTFAPFPRQSHSHLCAILTPIIFSHLPKQNDSANVIHWFRPQTRGIAALHDGLELGHTLVSWLVRSYCSLIYLLRFARFTRAVCCGGSLTRSRACGKVWILISQIQAILNQSALRRVSHYYEFRWPTW